MADTSKQPAPDQSTPEPVEQPCSTRPETLDGLVAAMGLEGAIYYLEGMAGSLHAQINAVLAQLGDLGQGQAMVGRDLATLKARLSGAQN